MQIAVEIEEGAGAVAQTADHPKSARPVSSGRNGTVSADSFRALTARLRKSGDPAAAARPAPSLALSALAERVAKPKPVAEAAPALIVSRPSAEPSPVAPPEAFAGAADAAQGIIDAINAAAPPLALPAEPPEAARDIIATINTAISPAPAAPAGSEQDELEQIRAAIFAPLKPFTPHAPEPSFESFAAAEAFDPFWTPEPPSPVVDEPAPVVPEAAVPEFSSSSAKDREELHPAAETAAPQIEADETEAPSIALDLPVADPADALHSELPAESALADDVLVSPVTDVYARPEEPVADPVADIFAVPEAAVDEAAPEADPVIDEATAAAPGAPGPEMAELPFIEAAPEALTVELAAEAETVRHEEPAEAVAGPVVEAAVLPEPDTQPVAVDAPEFVPVPLPGEEPKTAQQAALAGKVVDAMLKTISAAVYAKPSASERAAFLREMAELMAEAAGFPPAEMELAPAPIAVIPPVIAAEAPAVAAVEEIDANAVADQPINTALADRIGTASPILKRTSSEPDPFALAQPVPRALIERVPEETQEADEESGELALTLLDMMSGGTGSLPHERTLAADTLLRILPRIPVKQLLAVVERVAIMEAPPALLVAKLIRDTRPEVVGPLLERCSHISDQDLMNAAANSDTAKLRMIARRRVLSTVLADFLIATGDPAVLLTLIRNPGAAFSHEAFFRLAAAASQHTALLAPLATRNDLPPPVAFELFWHVPQELRRFIFSRFLTDSENLNRILRITLATHGNAGPDNGLSEGRFPPREAVEQAVRTAAAFKLDEAAQSFAEMAGISRDTVLRIFADREGEPFTVLMKMLGCQRSKFEELGELLRNCDPPLLRQDRKADDLQAIFDSLSFNKARILITYWDWFVRKAGPYAEAA